MSRAGVLGWIGVGLLGATLSNSLALTRAGLPRYLEKLNAGSSEGTAGTGSGAEGGEQPGEAGGDVFLRRWVDWHVR